MEIHDIAYNNIPLTQSITLITEHQLQHVIALERVISHALLDHIEDNGLSVTSSKLIDELNKKINALHDEMLTTEKQIHSFQKDLHTDKARQKVAALLHDFEAIEDEFFKIENDTEHFLHTIQNAGILKAITNLESLEKQNLTLDNHLIKLLHTAETFSIESAKQAEEDEIHSVQVIIIGLTTAVLLAILIPFFIGRTITVPINTLIERINALVNGNGDLTFRINSQSKDEIGTVSNALDSFLEKLQKTLIAVNGSSTSLGKSSKLATDVIQQTLSSVERQKVATERVASAVTQMSQATEEVAKSSAEAAAVARHVTNKVLEGRQSAEETQEIIKRLARDVQSTSTDINGLMEETNNIGTVLETIQSIAEQTNLLALNAAIEAARAGETGRGFAVVADEVRSLAQRTQDSTISIEKLVETLQKEAHHAVNSMAKGLTITEECLQKSAHTAQFFEDAATAVNEISDFNAQIETATEEQVNVAYEVKKDLENINNIAAITSENTAMAEQSNQEIAANLVDLHANLNQFKT
ncbi:methyl-accepting chemotaxis protein [Marinomonas algicola]|uniref:methyl-accepting chemotaxis protein n=1 Tax=Marinomonas algicola TaxID=2773454 RepID=UPI001749D1A0|nr:methyl-accepting chemotaxis protein [Marinomonas algicola]